MQLGCVNIKHRMNYQRIFSLYYDVLNCKSIMVIIALQVTKAIVIFIIYFVLLLSLSHNGSNQIYNQMIFRL